ncbi:MAG: MBL fold metallo-hydrolase [Leptolyngbyaceae cyanobacterium T60_A2020_046]|nr:MBL fold metallo-hydrolase [Leptolyngbyaceae cyanobacterium T60_A2020_046]
MPDSDSPSLTDMPAAVAHSAATSSSAIGFTVQFWGVRGSVPTPGSDTVRYGGNTACVEVCVGGNRLIFDGGTGLRVLGKHLIHQEKTVEAHLFFTHTHWDRIQGFPFFIPAFSEGNRFEIYGATAPNGASIKQCLTDQMLRPNFFTPLQRMRADLEFHNIVAGDIITLQNDVVVEALSLNPHTSALGFRVSWQGHSFVYATDTDNTRSSVDQNLLYLAQKSDLLIYDGTYADTAYHDLNGSATISWESGIELAKEAGVREMILFHHNPAHDDDFLDHLEMEIRQRFPKVRLAREGMILQLA